MAGLERMTPAEPQRARGKKRLFSEFLSGSNEDRFESDTEDDKWEKILGEVLNGYRTEMRGKLQ